MTVCRACGQGPPLNGAPFESFQNHARIYLALTAIQLHDHEDPDRLELCSDCVDKLSEFDRFRHVCLRVHYGLQVKTEPEHDLLKDEYQGKEQASSSDDEVAGGEEPLELEDDELGFEEVNIDEEWAELKHDPHVTGNASWQNPSVILTIEPNVPDEAEYVTGDIGPRYFSADMLVELLQSSSAGRHIMESSSLGPLSKDSRNDLVGIIIDRHYEMRLPTIEEVLKQYAEAITALFPYEIQDMYFIARGGCRRNHSGKLYNRIANNRKKRATYLQFIETISGNPQQVVEPPPKPSSKSYFLSARVLESLLKTTIVGRKLLENASLGPLSKDSQNELVTIIANRHLELKFPTKKDVLKQYAEAVTDLFKHETKETYFIARNGTRRNHGGKLYNRISNMRQKAYKRELYEERHLATVSQRTSNPAKKIAVEKPAYDWEMAWLKLNSAPWDTALELWTRTFSRRKDELTNAEKTPELLKKYEYLYRSELGYQLIEIDFKQLAVGDHEGLRKWSSILPSLVAHLSRSYQDDHSKAIAEHLSSNELDQDSMICGVLMLLNHELLPTKVRKNFKPSVLTAQQDVILIAETDDQVKAKLAEYETMYASYELPIVPKLVFRGKNIRELTGPYEVHYKGVVYRLDSASRAVDVLVKFSTVFGLEYSRICRLIWIFICSFIYDLPTAEHYESINKLKRLLEPSLPVC
ncbi:uncharacterized protein LOC5566000 [Aedes aegypti]|uniref:Uncharacterized protein n=1 Tax=Aedes aegypti TaxID=7159 RepID=A0A6I8U8U1_AEDAE|nr:uncharacterized protein LOC5566000 [Aedes aegypti]